MVAEVLVELKAKNIDQTFTYLINDKKVNIGCRVLVPFGNQKLEGFVLNIKENEITDYKLKEIISVIDEEPVLNEELLELGKYISKKTLSKLISSYQTMLPSALKAKNKLNINKKYVSYLYLNISKEEALKNIKNDKQKEIINLIDTKLLKSIATKISVSCVNTLIKNNIVKEIKEEQYRLDNKTLKDNNIPILTEEQKNVVDKISKSLNEFEPFLIHGVTGSGKTEVYMHIVSKVIKNNKTAIILVPEISLTPQLVDTFRRRFGSDIAILHSRLSMGEKYDEWRKIERNEIKIVIGARSAIFAPLTNIGLIVIDEEHSDTYKQENDPRYNAKDIALWRCRYHKCPLILGSATPQIESYTRCMTNDYTLCELKNRVNHNLPIVTLIDMKDEMKKGNRILSEMLRKKIEEKLTKNEQVILLLNRRGYTTITTCKNCGFVYKCPYCDIPLTYHKSSNTYRCHYCGYGNRVIYTCPNCQSKDLGSTGIGTEKLEQYISENINNSKAIRMDVDTTSKKGSLEKIINDFRCEKYNILIGTQMIAKGLDFPKVTLVGVVNGDASLNIPNFRSSERTFQLLNQVAGRAGRADLKGEVIIQGYNIDHYSIVYASKHDYQSFYNQELKFRKILKYSPYYNLCSIKIKSKEYVDAFNNGEKIVNYLKQQNLNDVIILGPSTGTMPKINNIYIVSIIIKYKKTETIYESLKYIKKIYKTSKVNVDIDLNPIRM